MLEQKLNSFKTGDVLAAINTAFEHSGVDIMLGSGGAPEGVLAAAALKSLEEIFKESFFHKQKKKKFV